MTFRRRKGRVHLSIAGLMLAVVALNGCSGGGGGGQPTAPQLSACESAVKAAADIDEMQDAVSDLDGAIAACASFAEFSAKAAGYPTALDGADAKTFVRNRCASNASLETSSVCVDVGHTDAEKAALVQENIDIVYCGGDPKPKWCAYLARKGGKPVVVADGTSLFVGVKSSMTKALAQKACAAIAVASFDDQALPIGFRHVHLQSGPDTFPADCDVPS